MFDIGVFTNLEPDHIGPNEHESFEDYLNCKAKLFKQCKVGIVNADDKHTKDILRGAICKVESYGIGDNADIKAENIELLHEPGKIGLTYDCTGLVKGLLARSVVVIDGDGKVVYTELVPEITQEPDYDKALAAVKR